MTKASKICELPFQKLHKCTIRQENKIIISYHGNANKNHNEFQLYTNREGLNFKQFGNFPMSQQIHSYVFTA